MKDHEGDLKQYILTSETYYHWARDKGEVDEVMFGFYSPEGGTSGEMAVRWHQLENGKPPVPRLECFNDGWHALYQFQNVLAAMAEVDREDITPYEFCALLEHCGFIDKTERVNPNKIDPEMTLQSAVEELHSMADSLEIDVPSDAGYVERVRAIADFLASIEWIERR